MFNPVVYSFCRFFWLMFLSELEKRFWFLSLPIIRLFKQNFIS